MRPEYADWLMNQGYNENTCNTQTSHIRQIEKYYGDLVKLIEDRGLDELIEEFTYTTEDERHNRPNPTKVAFSGRTYTRLQSLKGAIRRYSRFLEDGFDQIDDQVENDEIEENDPAAIVKQRFALERDMQIALRRDVTKLQQGLRIVDDGVERSVESGFVDILCEDDRGRAVVVELKAGQTDARVVAQILGYMGDLLSEGDYSDVRGIIVAHSFDRRTVSACRAIPNVSLATYSIEFTFEAFE